MTTALAPHRITFWQIAWAAIADRLGLEPDHEGANTLNWEHELRAMRLADQPATGRHHADNMPTVVIRRPIGALAATPHWAVIDDHLGPLAPGPLQPAHIHDELAGATR